ncbi:MAG: hypothetical protein K8953_10030 [Proteobacteria bacterium]|nr:hypothetical protein [Pseudomonadota bacterium]
MVKAVKTSVKKTVKKSVVKSEPLQAVAPMMGEDLVLDACSVRVLSMNIMSFAMPRGQKTAVAKGLKTLGLSLPTAPKIFIKDGVYIVQTQPDQWFFISDVPPKKQTEKQALKQISALGYCTDQSHGWVGVELSGADVLSVLERLCPLNLSHQAFAINSAARTSLDHLGVLMIRLGDNRFYLFSAASSAESFLHGIKTAILVVSD